MIKKEASEGISALPIDSDWEDAEYFAYVAKKVERGTKEALEGKGYTIEEARKMLGLP